MDYVFKRGARIVLNKEALSEEAQTTEIMNALYAAIYIEFSGATKSPKYSEMTLKDKISAVNDFAFNWLKERGLD